MDKNQCEIDVRFSEIDSMMIAHNSKYYVWFEIGRFHFSQEVLGLDKRSLLTEYRLPVVKSSCKYLSTIKFGDVLKLTTYMCPCLTGKIKFYYYLYNIDRLCAIGCTEHVMLTSDGIMLHKYTDEIEAVFRRALDQLPNCFISEDECKIIENRINR